MFCAGQIGDGRGPRPIGSNPHAMVPDQEPPEIDAGVQDSQYTTQDAPPTVSPNIVFGLERLFNDDSAFARITQARASGGGSVGGSKPPPPSRPQTAAFELTPRERLILQNGINDYEDLKTAFDFLSRLSPRWKEFVDAMDQLRRARIEAGETGGLGESFAIKIPGDGTYSVRSVFHDRVRELADGISLRPGDSIFALVHELTHALPLEILPPELASLPYSGDEPPQGASFAQTYNYLLEHLNQDEAISGFGELLLYRDMSAAGIALEGTIPEEELRWLQETERIYDRDGIIGYLQSERYIGRNHRLDYNKARLVQVALMAMFDPKILTSPGLDSVLQEHGVRLEGASRLEGQLDEVGGLLENPTADAISKFVGRMRDAGVRIELNVPRIIENIREAAALISGERQKAYASFVGREEETSAYVGLLAGAKRAFEYYRRGFEAWLGEKGGEKTWEDPEGLFYFYGMALDILRHTEQESRGGLEKLIRKVEKVLSNSIRPGILELEKARSERDVDVMRQALLGRAPKTFSGFIDFAYFIPEGEITVKIPRHVFKALSVILNDPLVRSAMGATNLSIPILMSGGGINKPSDYASNAALYPISPWSLQPLVDFLYVISSVDKPRIHESVVENFRHIINSFRWGKEEISPEMMEAVVYLSDIAQIAVALGGIEAARLSEFIKDTREIDLFGYDPADEIRDSSQYQLKLRAIRSGQDVRIRSPFGEAKDKGELKLIPTLFFIGEPRWSVPEIFRVFPYNSSVDLPPAIPVRESDYLIDLHLYLEREERRPSTFDEELEGKIKGYIESGYLESAYFGDLLSAGESKAYHEVGLEPDLRAPWLATRLWIRWARVMAGRGRVDLADGILDSLDAGLKGIGQYEVSEGIVRECRLAIGVARQFVPVWAAKTADERKNVLASIIDEYRTTVKLQRSGLTPVNIAILVGEIATDRALRNEIKALLALAIDHVVSFGNHTYEFRAGVAGIMSSIRNSDLIYQDKEELLIKLIRSIVPDRVRMAGLSGASVQRRYEVFNWMKKEMLSDETLEMLALYPKVETILFGRIRDLLKEVGSAYVPLEFQTALLEVASCLTRHVQHAHREVADVQNADRLGAVSSDMQYQSDLADVFESRRVVADPDLPVAQWHPVSIRKGVIDSEVAWKKIKSELEGALSNPVVSDGGFEKVLEIYRAHALHELEAAVEHGDVDREVGDLFHEYEERRKALSGENGRDASRAALTIIGSAKRIMDRIERVRLDEIMSIPAFSWMIARADNAFGEGRALTDNHERALTTLLSTSTIGDARRMRELYLALIQDERYPVAIRRYAARGLAYASGASDIFKYLIDGFEMTGDQIGERRFYRTVTNYWQRFGALPDDMGILLLDEQTKNDETAFWIKFDEVMGQKNLHVDSTTLELIALSKGSYAERFIEDASNYVSGRRGSASVFQNDLDSLFPRDIAECRRFIPVLNEVRARLAARKERAQLATMGLPAAFINQPEEVRALLLLFVRNMSQTHLQSLLREMHHIGETKSDAEVFNHFFLRTGLAKAGQFLSTMVGLVPDADRAVYARLQDRVPPSSITEVKRAVEQELGRPLKEVFSWWNEEPIASASMGEVYEAKLMDGSLVYVKISPPTKRAQIESAIATLLKVAKAWEERRDRSSEPFDIAGQIKAFAKQLEGQLNFKKEWKNVVGIGAAEGYATPEYIEGMVTEHVLVMRPVAGVKVTELADAGQRSRVAGDYAGQALKMLMSGEYHADPHPGNVFWDAATAKLSWLDWGVVGTLGGQDKQKIVELLTALTIGDDEAKLRSLEAVAGAQNYDRAVLQSGLGETNQPEAPADKLVKLLSVASSARLYIKPGVMRTLAFLLTVNGVVHDLDPARDFSGDVLEAYAGSQSAPERAPHSRTTTRSRQRRSRGRSHRRLPSQRLQIGRLARSPAASRMRVR